jgi:hypothetical protein
MSLKPRPALPRSASGHISAINKPIVAEDWDLSKSAKKIYPRRILCPPAAATSTGAFDMLLTFDLAEIKIRFGRAGVGPTVD